MTRTWPECDWNMFHIKKIRTVEHFGSRSPSVPHSKFSQRENQNCGSLGEWVSMYSIIKSFTKGKSELWSTWGVGLQVFHIQKFHKGKFTTVEHLGTRSPSDWTVIRPWPGHELTVTGLWPDRDHSLTGLSHWDLDWSKPKEETEDRESTVADVPDCSDPTDKDLHKRV